MKHSVRFGAPPPIAQIDYVEFFSADSSETIYVSIYSINSLFKLIGYENKIECIKVIRGLYIDQYGNPLTLKFSKDIVEWFYMKYSTVGFN